MNLLQSLILGTLLLPVQETFAQRKDSQKLPFENKNLDPTNKYAVLPYNRLVKSAGEVISFGDPDLENHAMDLALIPGEGNVVVEHRTGIVVLKEGSGAILSSWEYDSIPQYAGLSSTYSGITSFKTGNKTMFCWSAAAGDQVSSALMIAEWTGKQIVNVAHISFNKVPPAHLALPNQVIANTEGGELFLYVVLNGNNQLVKLRFADSKTVWTAPTGVAPYGICITGNTAWVTNWAGPLVTDTTKETAGTPWGSSYTDPRTGATRHGTVSLIDITNGQTQDEIHVGLHPNAIIATPDNRYIYVANGNSDNISVIDVASRKLIDSLNTGLFSKAYQYFGSSPNGLFFDSTSGILYVANGMDNAVAVVKPATYNGDKIADSAVVKGFIPTEAYPSGIVIHRKRLYVTNLEAKGARVLAYAVELKTPDGNLPTAYSIHRELASVSIIPVPDDKQLAKYTDQVKELNLFTRIAFTNAPPRPDAQPKPLPERIGEPSIFKHVIYIIKENKTYDQVLGDVPQGRGEKNLCIFGSQVTPNHHKLANDFQLMDNYYASGKSSAEGHQWTDAAMVSDYVEKNVRAWFRSYPHRQTDALVYNRNGFIWNNAMDHGKKVRVYGEGCTTRYDPKLRWKDIYQRYVDKQPLDWHNTSTIARLRPIISPTFPDCDNISFPDQIRADVFIEEWKQWEKQEGDNVPDLLVLSLPNDHTAGLSEQYPTPRAMVADNDLAVGRIVEAVTNSRFWDSTVIFITQDDSQSGWDHISPYRTIGFVLSPYSIVNKPIHTNYNQTSMVRTIEQILGIPPMTIIDATALPMFDCFTDNKSNYKYTAVKNNIPLNEMNKPVSQLKGKALYYAKLSSSQSFREIDNGDDDNMNRIIWFDAKGEEKYPGDK